MIKMVAFDFDGTIADTIPICIEAFKKAVSPYAGHLLTEDEIIQTFGLNELGMIKTVVKDDWESALQDFYYYYEKMHSNCWKPFSQIGDLILYLKEKGVIVPLVTGKGQVSCDISLKMIDMRNCFSEIMPGDEKRPNKSDSIIKLLKKYQIKNDEFYYVGDAVSDVMACREANVTCLSAAWSSVINFEELNKINPNYIFENIIGLRMFLESKLSDGCYL